MYREYRPSIALRPSVSCYWASTASGARRVLPDGCIDILFASANGLDWRSVVVGAMSTSKITDGSTSFFVGVRFKPGEAIRFLDVPAHETTDREFSLDNVWGRSASRFSEQISECGSIESKLAHIDAELVRRLALARPADFRLRRAIARIEQDLPPIEQVACECGIGVRQLHRLFSERVGLSPKVFSRVVRLQDVLRLLTHPETRLASSTLARAAALGGFADQPHFSKEFKALVGVGPRSFLIEREMSDSYKPSPTAFDIPGE